MKRNVRTASEEIDAIIAQSEEWKGKVMSQLREAIKKADADVIEEVKWKKPSNPFGVPVWSHDGIICMGNVLKRAVRLTFPKGAQIEDPTKFFNTRLDSKTVRATDILENDAIDKNTLRRVIRAAVSINKRGKGKID